MGHCICDSIFKETFFKEIQQKNTLLKSDSKKNGTGIVKIDFILIVFEKSSKE
jgi:hypothetical protein